MKKLIRMTLVTAFVFAAGYSVYQSQKEVTLPDLILENVEALARSEIENYHGFFLDHKSNGCNVCERGSGICNVHSQGC